MMLRWLAALLIRGPDRHHIVDDLAELYARDLARGLTPARARWRYLRNMLSSAASVHTLRWQRPRLPGISRLDLTLARRMLVKHPGLTLVGCFALAVGVPIALAPLQLIQMLNAPLPFPDGDRLVGLEYWDLSAFDESEPTIHDYERWQTELRSFERLAAAKATVQNLIGRDGRAEVIRGAELSASTFAVLRVKPHLGRPLLESDEARGAPPVVLIGYDLWQTRFASSPNVLDQSIQLGETSRRIVGVMPRDFAYPVRDKFWVPLQYRGADYEHGRAPNVWVIGRLRGGVSRGEAQTELTAVARRFAAQQPETHARLRADVLPVQQATAGLRADIGRVWPAILMSVLLLCVTCGNIGTLTLARTVGRASEIAMRTALGASRSRIVLQLFVESLVLALVATAWALLLAQLAANQAQSLTAAMPFWFDLRVKPFTILVAASFATICALIAGVLPALKITGRQVYQHLYSAGTVGGGVRFGALSTLLVVAEVAIAVGCLSIVGTQASSALTDAGGSFGIAQDEYIGAQLRLPIQAPTREVAESFDSVFTARLATLQAEITRRLEQEPGVRAVTYASDLPGTDHSARLVEVEGVPQPSTPPRVRRAWIEPSFFDALGQTMVSGRAFVAADAQPTDRPVIVNRSFVDQVLQGQNAVGRRMRFLPWPGNADEKPEPWLEIVGVVNDLGMNAANPGRGAGVYHVAAPGELQPTNILVQVQGDPAAFIPRLRSIVTSVDPTMLLQRPAPLDKIFSELRWQARFSSMLFAAIAAIAIVLSAAGIYALIAFTVSQRTREIGLRIALGAHASMIARVVVMRALLQIGAGVALGIVLGMLLMPEVTDEANRSQNWPAVLAAVATVMVTIGVLACARPIRRAVRIQPLEALRDGG